jgi:hypothetical protein
MGQKGVKKGGRHGFEQMLSSELLKPLSCPVWEREGYCFNFAHTWGDCGFRWEGKRIYITSCEALHLYQRLVLGRKPPACTSPHALYGMRKRFGSTFLQEYLPAHTQMRRKGRESDLSREADGSYYKRLFDKYRKGDS